MTAAFKPLCFTLDEAQAASDAWGFNCGPAALAAVLGFTPDQLRPHLRDFEAKGYTSPSMMASILRDLKQPFRRIFQQVGPVVPQTVGSHPKYPRLGLVRLQWDGPWCKPGVPLRVRYRHTHWVAMQAESMTGRRCSDRTIAQAPARLVFDINAMCVGGWIGWAEWATELTPWLISQVEPEASGLWWPTHSWELSS